MLDVHPPHTSTHTWRDFFIHIATIVIGLLIAIGLEQTVEAIHHHHQLADAREQLQTELDINIATFHNQTAEIHRFVPLLQRDLAVLVYLRAHPGAPRSSWPGELSWFYINPTYVNSAWASAHESGVLTLMSRREVQRRSEMYSKLDEINQVTDRAVQLVWRSFSYGVRDEDPSAMTSAQIDDSIQAVTDTLVLYAHMVNLQINLHREFPEFSPAPDFSDQRKIAHVASPAQDQAAARALSKQLDDEIERIQKRDQNK